MVQQKIMKILRCQEHVPRMRVRGSWACLEWERGGGRGDLRIL